MQSKQRGFTLPELLVAGAIIAVILVTGAFLISSKVDVDEERRDAQRRVDVASLAIAFKAYMADKQKIPEGISTEELFIGNGEEEYDLCPFLVPAYTQDLPFDPLNGLLSNSKSCPTSGEEYSTGYSIQQKDQTVILAAPFGETDQEIKIELDY